MKRTIRRIAFLVLLLIASGGVLLWAIGAYRNVTYVPNSPGGAHMIPPTAAYNVPSDPGRVYGAGCGSCPYQVQEDDPATLHAMDQCLADHLHCHIERKEDGSLEVIGEG
jgi:hypothetical protein